MTQQAKDRWNRFWNHNILTLIGMAGSLLIMMHYADVTVINFEKHVDTIDTAVHNLKADISVIKKDVLVIKTGQDSCRDQVGRLQLQINFIFKQLDYQPRRISMRGRWMHTFDRYGNVVTGGDVLK